MKRCPHSAHITFYHGLPTIVAKCIKRLSTYWHLRKGSLLNHKGDFWFSSFSGEWLIWYIACTANVGCMLNGLGLICFFLKPVWSQLFALSLTSLVDDVLFVMTQSSYNLPVFLETCVLSLEYSSTPRFSENHREPRALSEAPLSPTPSTLSCYHAILPYFHIRLWQLYSFEFPWNMTPAVPSLISLSQLPIHSHLDVSNDSCPEA